MTAIIIVLLFLGLIVYTIYPAISAPHSSEFTTQDGLEDVVKEETTKDIVDKNNIELEKKLLDVDFVERGAPFDEPINYSFKEKEEKCPTHETEGVRQLSEHIKDVVQKTPEKVKRLTKREKKVVKKISDKS